jgi:hypothetical protein
VQQAAELTDVVLVGQPMYDTLAAATVFQGQHQPW